MAAYVKICPRCGHRNDELASICEKDGEFLGMVPAAPAHAAPPEPVDTSTAQQLGPEEVARGGPERDAAETGAGTGRHVVLSPASMPGKALYLDVDASGQYYQVRDGWVVGQSHSSSPAEIQLSGLPGINFVHRRHCAFEFADNEWRVKPLPQADYTNPTFLNEKRLLTGKSFPLRNGDVLRCASVTLRVRIIDL